MQEFPLDELGELYRDVILRHYRRPRSSAKIEDPDIEYDEYNPVCGDQVVLQMKLSDDRIGQAGFQGEGCSISQASASIMAELLEGKTLEEAELLSESFRRMMLGETHSEAELELLGDLEALQGVRKFPVRIKCALLAWTALEEGIAEYRTKGKKW